ncbi:MAG: tRNA preQ1(34) S-adenosylmethionine ribosyltransferase-isomerase QueA [Alcaligenaceae bacterium]|nr:tRNA preQ1(34) S-adenosylmethionine ribosyltransferase-isomerase QueA [Alcaligenaceae bacterium]
MMTTTSLTTPSVSADLLLSDFDYDLPEELIAQSPAEQRNKSRLLRVDAQGQCHDHQFTDLIQFLKPNDLLIFNNTKVIKARLFGQKETGGKVELLVERLLDENRALAHIRASKSPKLHTKLLFAEDQFSAEVIGREEALFELVFSEPLLPLLDQYGQTPLPPYITHTPDAEDDKRYQTVYAKTPGAVAAPTAGLHFDDELLARLGDMGVNTAFVTLHVGAGTFQPVRTEEIKDHIMHAEWYEVEPSVIEAIKSTRAAGGRVIAVGTTSVRALESAAQFGGTLEGMRCPIAHQGDTRLFITPGYQFKVVDALITNFHLPQSTLLMLVSALMGLDNMKKTYAHAIKQQYRFFSYGDSMFIDL